MIIRPVDTSILPSVQDGVSLFASREWAALYPYHIQAYVLQGKNEQVSGSFLLFHKAKFAAKYTITPPLAPHIGLHVNFQAEKTESIQTFKKNVHKAIAKYLHSRNDALLQISLSTEDVDSQPYTWQDLSVRPRHTYLLDLGASEESLLDGMSSERRKNIRKAMDDGLSSQRTSNIDSVRELLWKTIERQKVAIDKTILESLLTSQAIKDNRAFYLCSLNGEPLAASLVVWDKDRMYYLIGGYDPENAHQGAGTLNLWQAMLDAKLRGHRIFDFEGSMIPEIERYFRGFGGELKTFFSVEHKNWLGEIATRVKK